MKTLVEKMARAGWLYSGTAVALKTAPGGANLNVNPSGLKALKEIQRADAALGELTAEEAAILVSVARQLGEKGQR